MKRIYILSTCDNWKSRGSMIRYYVGSSDKAGTRRLLAAIKKGIREHIFRWATNGEKVSVLQLCVKSRANWKAARWNS